MGLSTTTTIFLFVVCLCGGIVIGAMFGRARKAPPEKEERREEEGPKAAAPEKSLARPGETEVLRAWRNEQDKAWLEMDGQRLEAGDELQAGQKQKLLNLVLDLRPWLEAPAAPAPTARETPPAAEPARQPAEEKKAKAEMEKPVVSLKSIVGQIDDVLQEKLAGTVFAKEDIHLLEGAGGEVMVQIGPAKHAGIEAVPNPEIRALIRQAVSDWEKEAH